MKKKGQRRGKLAADAVVVVIMTDAAVMRIGVCGGDGEAENGQAENGKQNLFHGNLLRRYAMDGSCMRRFVSGTSSWDAGPEAEVSGVFVLFRASKWLPVTSNSCMASRGS